MIPNIRRVYRIEYHDLSMQPAEVYGEAVKQYGINYYLPKSTGEEEMLQLLQRFLQNEVPLKRNPVLQNPENPFSSLSPRELEILHYLLKGWEQRDQ